MRKIVFIGYVAILVLMAVVMGCGTENPICTDAFCIVSRESVEGDVTEIDNAKVLALIDTLAVDTPDNTGPLAEIVADTEAGGTAYQGRFVTVKATIEENFTITGDTSDGMTIETGNDLITFFVSSWGTRERLQGYEIGETYDLTLFIAEQKLSANHDLNNDFSRSIWSHYAPDGADPVVVSPQTLLADATAGNQRYQGRVVRVTETVRLNTPTSASMYFQTGGFFARKTGHPDEATMQPGQTYTIDVFITSIGKNASTTLLEIRTYLVWKD